MTSGVKLGAKLGATGAASENCHLPSIRESLAEPVVPNSGEFGYNSPPEASAREAHRSPVALPNSGEFGYKSQPEASAREANSATSRASNVDPRRADRVASFAAGIDSNKTRTVGIEWYGELHGIFTRR